MHFTELGSFDALHTNLAWPWIAFDASGTRFAFIAPGGRIASAEASSSGLIFGSTFALPEGLELPGSPVPGDARRTHDGLYAFSIDPAGTRLAFVGVTSGASVFITTDADGREHRSQLATLLSGGFTPQAVAFDRSGERVWISADSDAETAVLLLNSRTHALVGVVRSGGFPPPAVHELKVHPKDDAVLLLAACGQDGTYARVVGWSGEDVAALPTALDGGGLPSGLVGFSADGSRAHLAEADELRTHVWPDLKEISSVQLKDDFVSSYAGAVLGDRILVDGNDSESGEDAVMVFDRTGRRGSLLAPPFPIGMWAGCLGVDVIVTIEAKGDPARGRVIRVALEPDLS